MNLEELLATMSKEDISRISKVFHSTTPTPSLRYDFDEINEETLKSLVDIEYENGTTFFEEWLDNTPSLEPDTLAFLKNLLEKEGQYLNQYHYEDLKIKFVAPLLNHIDFNLPSLNVKDFYEASLSCTFDTFVLEGKTDFIISQGIIDAQKPYFFILAFWEDRGDKPSVQLLTELICAMETNHTQTIKGAYVLGAIWNFVIVQKTGDKKYHYQISPNYDSSQINTLSSIYANLLSLKTNIIKQLDGVEEFEYSLIRPPNNTPIPVEILSDLVWEDPDTYLIWQREHKSAKNNWESAFAYSRQLSYDKYAGFEDWRVPTLEELQTLLTTEANTNAQKKKIYIKKELIDSVNYESSGYWSATHTDDDNAYYVYFKTGETQSYSIDFSYFTRCVRG